MPQYRHPGKHHLQTSHIFTQAWASYCLLHPMCRKLSAPAKKSAVSWKGMLFLLIAPSAYPKSKRDPSDTKNKGAANSPFLPVPSSPFQPRPVKTFTHCQHCKSGSKPLWHAQHVHYSRVVHRNLASSRARESHSKVPVKLCGMSLFEASIILFPMVSPLMFSYKTSQAQPLSADDFCALHGLVQTVGPLSHVESSLFCT